MMKKFNLWALALLAAGLIVGCGPKPTPDPDPDPVEEQAQGIRDGKIYVGNTAATSGAYATVGVPFNAGLKAALKVYNDAGGFGDEHLKVELKHYDDGFDATQGVTYTKKLIEEDEVFALVGHFGTPTVGATLDDIKETGVPMVYAATGISGLYNEAATGKEKAIMSVQPIYNSEGRVLLARAFAATEGNKGLGATKVGVISTTDEAGTGLLAGIKRQAQELSTAQQSAIKYVTTEAKTGTNHSSPVSILKNAGCDVVIIAANQTPFEEIMNYMRDGGYDNVKVITSYVSANATLAQKMIQNGAVTDTRQAYTTAWLDITSSSYVFAPEATDTVGSELWAGYKALVAAYPAPYNALYDAGVPGFSEEYWGVAKAIYAGSKADGNDVATAFEYSYNSYALAGYIAGKMFVEGLARVDAANKVLSWDNYIACMEQSPINVALGGAINFANGARLGIQELALNKFNLSAAGAGELAAYSPIISFADVWGAVPASYKK